MYFKKIWLWQFFCIRQGEWIAKKRKIQSYVFTREKTTTDARELKSVATSVDTTLKNTTLKKKKIEVVKRKFKKKKVPTLNQ